MTSLTGSNNINSINIKYRDQTKLNALTSSPATHLPYRRQWLLQPLNHIKSTQISVLDLSNFIIVCWSALTARYSLLGDVVRPSVAHPGVISRELSGRSAINKLQRWVSSTCDLRRSQSVDNTCSVTRKSNSRPQSYSNSTGNNSDLWCTPYNQTDREF